MTLICAHVFEGLPFIGTSKRVWVNLESESRSSVEPLVVASICRHIRGAARRLVYAGDTIVDQFATTRRERTSRYGAAAGCLD